METICQINFNLLSDSDQKRVEAVVRDYLLRVSDQVSMSIAGTFALSFIFSPLGFRARRFTRLLNDSDVAEKSSSSWTFNLTENIKNFINQTTLFLNSRGDMFYGFTDPKFTHHGNELASLITNKKQLHLYISDMDKEMLVEQGVPFDNTLEV